MKKIEKRLQLISMLFSQSSKKRGISTIIATVLTVLITVAAVTILWLSIQPILSKANFIEPMDAEFSVESDSYTFYDSNTGYLSVRIKRGSDDNEPEVVALKFLIDINGNTISRKTYNVMDPNNAYVYYFLVGFQTKINSVKVVPVYNIEGEEVEGKTFDIALRIPINPGKIGLTELPKISIVKDIEEETNDNPLTEGLVLYYSFDSDFVDTSKGMIIDESGLGHYGTITNAISDDGFMTFDGDGDYIQVQNGPDLRDLTKEDKTITFWVRFDCNAPEDFQAPFGSYQNYYISFAEVCTENAELSIGYKNSAPFYTQYDWFNEGIWNFYAIVFDKEGNNEITIYRRSDDAFQVEGPYSVTFGTDDPNHNFYVGTTGGSNLIDPALNSYLKGDLDDLRIYNKTLDESEIKKLYDYLS